MSQVREQIQLTTKGGDAIIFLTNDTDVLNFQETVERVFVLKYPFS